MFRGITLAVVLTTGCSKLLGLQQPTEASDASSGGSDGSSAPPGDFTIQLAHASARVPAGSFDFVDVVVMRGTGSATPIDVSFTQAPLGVMITGTTIAPGDTTGQVKVTGDPSLKIGSTVMIDITATDGVHTHDVMVPLTVTGVPGTLDVSFGSNNNGVVDIPLGTEAGQYNALAVDGSDDVIAAGVNASELASEPAGAIVGANGNLVATLAENPCSCTAGGAFQTVTVDGAGRIFEIGINHNKTSGTDQPFIAAFTTAGALDTSFASPNGFQFYATASGQFNSAAVDGPNVVLQDSGGQLSRISANGQVDLGWNGADPLPVGITPGLQAVAVDVAQHVYVAGGSNGHAVIERITETGAIDTAVGTNGVIDSGVAGIANAIAVQPDHAVVAAGSTTSGGNLIVFRALSTGALDPAFGTGGVAAPAVALAVTGIAIQSDGKILVAGNGGGMAELVRFLPSGALDPTFGTNGVANIPAGLTPIMAGVGLQSTHMIVIDGFNTDQPHSNGIDGNGFVARVWF